VDQWFLNLFPRPEPYRFTPSGGGYQTLNFLPAIATMLLGLMAGELLRSERTPRQKLVTLLVAGSILLSAGMIAGWTVCPVVKRIWTPAWTLFSGGWAVWLLAAFYAVIDVAGWRRWAWPLVVVGMNSILFYLMAQLMHGWTWGMIKIHFGPLMKWGPVDRGLDWLFGPQGFNPVYLPIVESLAVLLAFWLICWWLYQKRLFVRI